jgi:hypothetical protein
MLWFIVQDIHLTKSAWPQTSPLEPGPQILHDMFGMSLIETASHFDSPKFRNGLLLLQYQDMAMSLHRLPATASAVLGFIPVGRLL